MMMRVKFNKFERIAGIFVLAAAVGGVAFMLSVAHKQGWFDQKIYFTTEFTSADGVHSGSMVQMAGLRAGAVDEVDLVAQNRIRVKFYVLSKFKNKIRQNSEVTLIRPFIIGERVLDVSVGSEDYAALGDGSVMVSRESTDLLTLISGKGLGEKLETMASMLTNLKSLAEAFLDKTRTEAIINSLDRIDPLLRNLNAMSIEVIKLSKQVTRDDNLGVVLSQLAVTTKELNGLLPQVSERAPAVAKAVDSLLQIMNTLTSEFKSVIPALREVAPELPSASRRALEALDEAVVLMKAMQKSFFMRSNAREVREEEALETKKGSRKPSRSTEPTDTDSSSK